MSTLNCNGRSLDLSRPQAMGVLNVTPDSFSDGGKYDTLGKVIDQARFLIENGAGILDIGGESTRPGSASVSVEEELARVVPAIEAIVDRFPIPISIDTVKPQVMTAAVHTGAGLVNDIYALQHEGAVAAVKDLGVPVCLMHCPGIPATMQDSPRYDDVVAEVKGFLAERMNVCRAAGIPDDLMILDPGFGFGKSDCHNGALMAHLSELDSLGRPLLVGVSRKSWVGRTLDLPVTQRLEGSLALAALAVWQGAKLIRVHDVKETVRVIRMVEAVLQAKGLHRCGEGA